MWKTFPRGTLAGYQKDPGSSGRIFKGYGHSSTKRMDIIKSENECALLKYSGISHDFREGQRYCFSLFVRISPRCIHDPDC